MGADDERLLDIGRLRGARDEGPEAAVNTPFADLGNILPTGLDLAGLTALLTNKAWGGPTAAGGDFDLVVSQVPEPGSAVLLAVGLLGLACYGWRRQRKLAA